MVRPIQPHDAISLGFRTGLRGTFATFGDTYAVQLGAGLWFRPLSDLSVGVEYHYPRPLGPANTPALRHLWVQVRVRFD